MGSTPAGHRIGVANDENTAADTRVVGCPYRPPAAPTLARPRLLGCWLTDGCCTTHASVKKRSCAWAQRAGSAQGTVPRALPGPAPTLGCFPRRPEALTCRSQRAHPARLAAQGVPNVPTELRWPAAMRPRNGGLPAGAVAAWHGAADGAGPSIEGARTYAHGTSRGAVAVMRARFGPRSV